MAELPRTHLDALPRMADFALFGEAGSRAEGAPAGMFLAAYAANREQADEIALEASPVALAVLALMSNRPAWVGTAEKLLTCLEEQIEASRRRKGWPFTPRGLAGALRRAAPGLRSQGIDITFARGSDRTRTRTITLTRRAETGGPTPS